MSTLVPQRTPASRNEAAAAAAGLVASRISEEHPASVRQQLAKVVAALAAEGKSDEVLSDALGKWLAHPNAGPRMLSTLVSDVIRERQGAGAPRSTTDDRIAALQRLRSTPAPPLPPGRTA